MLHAVLNKSWNEHPTKQQLYDLLLPISQTTQVRQKKTQRIQLENQGETPKLRLNMNERVLADQQRRIYVCFRRTQDVTLKICQERAMSDRDG